MQGHACERSDAATNRPSAHAVSLLGLLAGLLLAVLLSFVVCVTLATPSPLGGGCYNYRPDFRTCRDLAARHGRAAIIDGEQLRPE
jgi:hypothetical protein